MRFMNCCNPWALIMLLTASSATFADDSALRRCRALADGAARLACYDALPLAAAAGAALPAAVPSADRAAPSAPAARVEDPAATFGLPRQQDAQKEITSRIIGRFEGWRPGERIRLANGQVWQVSDDSSGAYYLLDPKVTVRRGALSSFWLDVDGAKHSPRVRRVE
jgi:hypothetical protein